MHHLILNYEEHSISSSDIEKLRIILSELNAT